MYESFVINLDHHTGRLAFMRAQFEALGLRFTRIPGINGYDPTVIAQTAAASYALLPNGEIGCFESHRSAWKQIVERGLPGAYVFEDDMLLASDFGELRYPEEILQNSDIIKIDTYPRDCFYGTRKISLSRNRHLQRLLGTENSAGGYFVTNRGAQRMLANSKRFFIPVDVLMFAQESKLFWNLVVWKVFPSVAAQMRFFLDHDALPSEIADGIQAKRRTNRDPRPHRGFLQRTQLHLRRLADWDFGLVRRRRATRNIAAFDDQEGIVTERVLFETSDRTHIDRGLESMAQT